MSDHATYAPNDPAAVECYRDALRALAGAGVEVMVGGAYAYARYAGIARHTKDFDLYLRAADRDRALAALEAEGFLPEVTYTHWLAKAFRDDYFIDLLYNSGNAAAPIDDTWFAHGVAAEVLGEPARLCPPEELLWHKAFVMERDRFDGADINHLLRAAGPTLDWHRLFDRFGPKWRVLLAHLVLFGFAYPGERDRVPGWVMDELAGRLREESTSAPPDSRLCRGTLLAALEYLPDVERWGYEDARLPPHGTMTPRQRTIWTEGLRHGR